MSKALVRKHDIIKMLILKYAKAANQNICYRCQKPIESADDLSIEHIIPWNGNVELFYDEQNLSISHLACNTRCRSADPIIRDAMHHYLRTGKRKCIKCGRIESVEIKFRKSENTCCDCLYIAHKKSLAKKGIIIKDREDIIRKYETLNGVLTAQEIEEHYHISAGVFRSRIRKGWSVEDALRQRRQTIPEKNIENYTIEQLMQATGRRKSTLISQLYYQTASQLLKKKKRKFYAKQADKNT